MASTTGAERTGHPVVVFASRVHEVLDTLAEAPVWSLTPAEQESALVELARAEARIAGLRLRVLAAADAADVATDSAASSTAAWVAHRTRQVRSGPGGAHADVRLAQELDTTWVATREALAQGRVNTDQARVIVAALCRLPESVETSDRERAEKHLVHLAGEHDATALRVLGRRVFEVIDPDTADELEGRRLAAEETAAARACFLHLADNGDGTHTGRFKIPTLHAVMLTKALHALTAPGQVERRSRTRPELFGEGFCRLMERLPADRLPTAGGVSATVVVLLDYDRLLSGLGAARLDTGEQISAGAARRLACEAGIIPVVHRRLLDGPSVVLDVGRRRRFHTPTQRIALTIRDRGCTAEGCDRPPGWCHAHHDHTSWAHGGDTDVEHARLLCAFHHSTAHHPDYTTEHLPSGKIRFHRKT